MVQVPNVVIQWGIAVGVEGTTMTVLDFGLNEFKKQKFYVQIKKTLKQYTNPVIAVGISLVSIALAYARLPEVAVRATRVVGSWGVYKVEKKVMCLEPDVVAADTQTIEVFCLDPGKFVAVYIDGNQINVQASTDSRGYAKISIPAVSEGVHRILVHTGFKAAFSEEYVA